MTDLVYRYKKDTEMRDADDLEEETVIPDLRQDKPPERVLLDITDSRRYFESQSGGPDIAAIKKEVIINRNLCRIAYLSIFLGCSTLIK